MIKFGLNIHGYNLSKPTELMNWLRNNKPAYVLVLNNKELASQIADMNINVILRMTNRDDEIQTKYASFAEWWDLVKLNYQDKRLIVHFCNEPHSDYIKLNQMCLDGIQILKSEGLRGVFGNWGVGTPEPSDWNILSPLLNELEKYPNQFFLGLHEYFMYSLDSSYPYEIGRFKKIKQNVSIILTEFGADFIQEVYNRVQSGHLTGIADYNDERVLSIVNKIFQTVYNDSRIKGTCWFCFGNSGGWDHYNLESRLDFLDSINMTAQQTITNITPIDLDIESTVSVGTLRRSQPSTASTRSAVSLTTSQHATKIAVTNDGWSQYRFSDGLFWLSDSFVKVSASIKHYIQLINATEDDSNRFSAAIQTIIELGKKYEISYTSN